MVYSEKDTIVVKKVKELYLVTINEQVVKFEVIPTAEWDRSKPLHNYVNVTVNGMDIISLKKLLFNPDLFKAVLTAFQFINKQLDLKLDLEEMQSKIHAGKNATRKKKNVFRPKVCVDCGKYFTPTYGRQAKCINC